MARKGGLEVGKQIGTDKEALTLTKLQANTTERGNSPCIA